MCHIFKVFVILFYHQLINLVRLNRLLNAVNSSTCVTLLTQGVAFCQLTSTSSTDSTPVVHRRVLIADSNSQCIQVFSATTGECLLKFGIRGRQASQLQRPTGVAVTVNGNYLVADYDNKWVGVFSPEGKYINRSAHLPRFPFVLHYIFSITRLIKQLWKLLNQSKAKLTNCLK